MTAKHKPATARLGKQKNYCIVCQRQFNSVNDFTNHLQEQMHVNNSKLYLATASAQVSQASAAFRNSFLNLVFANCAQRPVLANTLYNQLISQKGAVKLASTRWKSVSGLLSTLESEGLIKVTQSAQGPMVELERAQRADAEDGTQLHRDLELTRAAAIQERHDRLLQQFARAAPRAESAALTPTADAPSAIKIVKTQKKTARKVNLLKAQQQP